MAISVPGSTTVNVAAPQADDEHGGIPGGRKMWITIVCALCIVAIAALRQDLPSEKLVEALLILAGTGVGGVMLEDIAKHFSKRNR